MLYYYAQRKTVKDGVAQTPSNYSYTTRPEAERQFYLLCAAAIANNDQCEKISVEYGTIEQGKIERRFYDFSDQFASEPEEEPIESET